MTIVSVVFMICWIPNNLIALVYANLTSGLAVGYYATVFLAYLNICLNPFIYATQLEGVKSELGRLMVCRKLSAAASRNEPSSSSRRNRAQ